MAEDNRLFMVGHCFLLLPVNKQSIWLDPGSPQGIREKAILRNKFQLAVLMEKTHCELPESRDDLQTKSQFVGFVAISICAAD